MDNFAAQFGGNRYGAKMRWQSLFHDLELELEALHQQQRVSETREHIRANMAEISLADRLRGNVENELQFLLRDGLTVRGNLTRCYPQWSLIKNSDVEALVPTTAIAAVRGLENLTAPPSGPTANRLTLGHALRALARDRSSVEVRTTGGQFVGIFGLIGQDWAQLRLHHPGETRLSRDEVTIRYQEMCAVLNKN